MRDDIVLGLPQLEQALNQLPAKIEANVLRGALRQGAKVQLARARDEVPVDDGDLKDSLRISTRRRRGIVKAVLRAGNAKAWYARLVEFGTAAHFIKPKDRKSLFFAGLAREIVEHPGAKKNPFMRRTLDATVQPAVDAIAAYIRRRLEKADIHLPDAENR